MGDEPHTFLYWFLRICCMRNCPFENDMSTSKYWGTACGHVGWVIGVLNVYVSITNHMFLYPRHCYSKVFLEHSPLLYVRFLFDVSALLLFCSWETVSLIFQRDKLFWCALISPGIFEGIKPLSSLLYSHSLHLSCCCPTTYTIHTSSLLFSQPPTHPSWPHLSQRYIAFCVFSLFTSN